MGYSILNARMVKLVNTSESFEIKTGPSYIEIYNKQRMNSAKAEYQLWRASQAKDESLEGVETT